MTNKIAYGVVAIIIIGIISVATLSKSVSSPQAQKSPVVVKDVVIPSDPQDIVPGTYPNQIKNVSTTTGLSIVSGLVENNIDAAGKVTDDHLELLLKNLSSTDMSNFEVYYTVTDLVTNKSEGYYKKLTGLIIPHNTSTTIHFDQKSGLGHFGVNKDGLYFTSKNKLRFNIEVSTQGFQVAHLEIFKDAGGAEVKD